MPNGLIAVVVFIAVVIGSRLFLKQVGKKALAKVPQTLSLVQTDSPNWLNRSRIDQQTAPLRFSGFEEVGSYQITEMPGVFVKILFHQATNVAAHICEHPKAGSWTEIVTRYTDGRSATITDLRDTGVSAPPWLKVTRVSGGSTDQMFKEHTAQRDKNGIKTVAPTDTVREFEDGHARYMAWKNGVGMSADEVARVARKRAEASSLQ